MRPMRVDSDEKSQRVTQRLANFPKAFESLLNIGRSPLDLDHDEVALGAGLRRTQREWHMDNEVWPNVDSVD